MTTRVVLVTIVAAVGGAAAAVTAEPAARSRPNVLVIVADDLGFSDLGCHGGEIDTPHLNRLAAGGLRFTQGYNAARCWPTRAALLTGYYPQAIGRDALPGGKGGAQGRRPGWAQLLPERLAAVGYRSYHSGKWHVDGDPRAQGFARSLAVAGAGESNYFDAAGVTDDGKPLAATPGFYATTAIGDHAVACLAEHARDHAGTPFFHYVAFTAPHFPLQAPPDLIAKYRDRYRAGWDEVRAARCRRVRDIGIVTTPAAEPEPDVGPPYQPDAKTLARLRPGEIDRPRPWAELTDAQQEFQAVKMAIHAAMVEAMDREVGRIVAQLEAVRALDDTLILFLSDNGASAEILIRGEGHDPAAAAGSRKTFLCLGPGWSTVANAPFRRHKTWVHEGGIATPWIVHWPQGVAGRGAFRTQPVHAIDLVPTVLEIARVPAQQAQSLPPLHGRSFAASLADAGAPPAHESLWWCHEGHRAVRTGDWKLVAVKGGAWELYDLATDHCETTNLAAADPDRVAALEREWNRIAAECRELAPAPAAARGASPRAGRRPNIIYVMTDDQGYGDVAALGNPVVRTPHLDRLHGQSVRLTEFHASPTCSPTRAALMTGRHEFHSGVTHTIHERERLALSATTLPQLLKTAGYTTGIFGKWHLGDEDAYQPGRRGFDRVFIHGGGGIGQSYPGSCGDAPGNTYFDPVIRSDGTFMKTKGYCTDVFFDAALTWIDERRKHDEPFFCYLTPNCPHSPYDCPPGADEKYLGPLEAAGITDPKQRATIARFYAMIENVDANMGRLLGKLDEWGLAEDTLVVFTTDNGSAAGAAVWNDGMRGHKGSPWRGGTRVPSFWRWPGTLPAGVDVPAVTAHIDVLPTLCELAGVAIPPAVAAKVEGRSLVPLLHDARAAWPDRPLVTHVGRWERGQAAASGRRNCRIREGRWSLVNTRNRPDSWELYDVSADPGERHDVAAAQPDVVRRLVATFDAWWAGVQPDLVNEDVDGPAENPFQTAFRAQFGPSRTPPAAAARRPNILVIVADDQSPFDLQAYDPASRLETPVLDALAARGCVLDAAYHMGSFSAAVCTPSRHMLMTGRSLWHLPIGPGGGKKQKARPDGFVRRCPPDIEDHVLAAVFNRAGYDTMRTCKQGNSYEGANRRFTVRHDATKREGTAAGGSAWHADRVLDFLAARAASGDTDPFLIWYGFSHPHDTRDGTPDLLAKYGATNHADASSPPPLHARQPPLPAAWLPRHPFDDTDLDVRDEVAVSGVWRRRDEATIRNELGREFACGENIDVQIGRVIDRLRATGDLDNTWIFYTADHGIAIGRHGLQGKQNLYEHTWRVPLIVAGPGVKPGSRAPGNVYLADVLATLCDIAGIEPPASNEGLSFLPVLSGEARSVRDVLYGAYSGGAKPGIRAVRRGNWKLVKYESPAGGLVTQLFDLEDNPAEFLAEHHDPAVKAVSHAAPRPVQKNLADDPAHAATRREMEALLLAEMRRLDDPYRFSDQPPLEASP